MNFIVTFIAYVKNFFNKTKVLEAKIVKLEFDLQDKVSSLAAYKEMVQFNLAAIEKLKTKIDSDKVTLEAEAQKLEEALKALISGVDRNSSHRAPPMIELDRAKSILGSK